jgi:hypothetical protein
MRSHSFALSRKRSTLGLTRSLRRLRTHSQYRRFPSVARRQQQLSTGIWAACDLNRGCGITITGAVGEFVRPQRSQDEIAEIHWPRHDWVMGRDPAEPVIPGLLSTDGAKAAVPSSPTLDAAKEATEAASQRHVLPKNLRHALSQLSDGELDELFEAALDEAKRRGRLPPSIKTDVTPSTLRPSELTKKRLPPTRQVDIAEVSLTRGQINAIRASFKAGITPSRIARQFGVSQSDVRKALATDPSK